MLTSLIPQERGSAGEFGTQLVTAWPSIFTAAAMSMEGSATIVDLPMMIRVEPASSILQAALLHRLRCVL